MTDEPQDAEITPAVKPRLRKIRRVGLRHGQTVQIGDARVTLKVRRRKPRDHYTLVIDTTPEVSPIVLDNLFIELQDRASQ